MATALDVLVSLGFETKDDGALKEVTAIVEKQSNILKEVQSALERLGKQAATTGTTQVQTTKATNEEYAKLLKMLQTVESETTGYAKTIEQLKTQQAKMATDFSAGLTKSTAETKKLQAEVDKLKAKLAEVPKEPIIRTTQVDAGTNALKRQTQASFALTQILREAPAFAFSFQTGLLAISNNIPILMDELKRLKVTNAEIIAQGGQAESVFSTLSKSFFSFGNIVTLGVAALTIFGPMLAEVAGDLFDYGDEAEKAAKKQEQFNKKVDAFKKQVQSDFLGPDSNPEISAQRRILEQLRARGAETDKIVAAEKKLADLQIGILQQNLSVLVNTALGPQLLGELSNDIQEKIKDLENKKTVTDLAADKEARDKAERDAKEAERRRKEAQEQLLKYQRELQDEQDGLQDEKTRKDIVKLNRDADRRIQDLKREVSLTVEAEQVKAQLVLAIRAKLINDIRKLQQGNPDLGGGIAVTGFGQADPAVKALDSKALDKDASDRLKQQLALLKDLFAQEAREDKERQQRQRDNLQASLELENTILSGVSTYISGEQAKTEALISEQQRRVDAAKDGSAEVLKAEEDRLQRLEEKNREYAENQKAINAAMAISQNIVNIALAIGASIQAADKGNPISFILTLAANAAAIALTIASLKDGFYEGGYTGEGDPRQEAGKVHKKEFVFDHQATEKIGKDKLEMLRTGKLPIEALSQSMGVNYPGLLKTHDDARAVGSSRELRDIRALLGQLLEAQQNAGGNVLTVDAAGVYASVQQHKNNKIKLNGFR